VVQVQAEDLILAQLALQPHGQHHLFDLALVALLRRQQQRFHHLLRDGAAALYLAAGHQVVDDGPHDAERIDAAMLVEGIILGRDEGVADDGRNLSDRHQVPLFEVKFADDGAVIGQHLRRHRRMILRQLLHRREGCGQLPAHQPHRRGAGKQNHDQQEQEQIAQRTSDPSGRARARSRCSHRRSSQR
jgi:hypothetical protein